MTNEEAIRELDEIRQWHILGNVQRDALQLAILALREKDRLEKRVTACEQEVTKMFNFIEDMNRHGDPE